MKHRVFLNLTEQLIMIFFFALTAAICLSAFVFSYTGSRDSGNRDCAVLAAEAAADSLKACGGDITRVSALLGGADGKVYYSADWKAAAENDGEFLLQITENNSGVNGLGKADITVTEADGEEIFSLSVCWQEAMK